MRPSASQTGTRDLGNGRLFELDDINSRLPRSAHAWWHRQSDTVSAWCRRRRDLVTVPVAAGRQVRRDRSRASRLRRIGHAALARQYRRPRQLLSGFPGSARSRGRSSRRSFARGLGRGRACGAQQQPPRLAHPGRGRRHPRQGRRAGRYLPEQRRAAHPRPLLRPEARRGDLADGAAAPKPRTPRSRTE